MGIPGWAGRGTGARACIPVCPNPPVFTEFETQTHQFSKNMKTGSSQNGQGFPTYMQGLLYCNVQLGRPSILAHHIHCRLLFLQGYLERSLASILAFASIACTATRHTIGRMRGIFEGHGQQQSSTSSWRLRTIARPVPVRVRWQDTFNRLGLSRSRKPLDR